MTRISHLMKRYLRDLLLRRYFRKVKSTPVLARLRGSLKGSPGVNSYRRYLEKKYR